jgi:hypothetical protein
MPFSEIDKSFQGVKNSLISCVDDFISKDNQGLIAGSVPYEDIVRLYHEELPMLPAVTVVNDLMKKKITREWNKDVCKQNLGWWSEYFKKVAECDFLLGYVSAWRANLDWLLMPSNMAKVLNNNYLAAKKPMSNKAMDLYRRGMKLKEKLFGVK